MFPYSHTQHRNARDRETQISCFNGKMIDVLFSTEKLCVVLRPCVLHNIGIWGNFCVWGRCFYFFNGQLWCYIVIFTLHAATTKTKTQLKWSLQEFVQWMCVFCAHTHTNERNFPEKRRTLQCTRLVARVAHCRRVEQCPNEWWWHETNCCGILQFYVVLCVDRSGSKKDSPLVRVSHLTLINVSCGGNNDWFR